MPAKKFMCILSLCVIYTIAPTRIYIFNMLARLENNYSILTMGLSLKADQSHSRLGTIELKVRAILNNEQER